MLEAHSVLNLITVAGNACLAEVVCVRLGRIFLVFDTHNIDTDAERVHTQIDPIDPIGRSARTFLNVIAVSDAPVRNNPAFAVLAIQKPQLAFRIYPRNKPMQFLHFVALLIGLAVDVLANLLLNGHRMASDLVSGGDAHYSVG